MGTEMQQSSWNGKRGTDIHENAGVAAPPIRQAVGEGVEAGVIGSGFAPLRGKTGWQVGGFLFGRLFMAYLYARTDIGLPPIAR
jgi:hypothetical protein